MPRKKITVLVAAMVAMLAVVSCTKESSFLGMETEVSTKTQTPSEEKNETKVSVLNTSYEAEFETETLTLKTIRQNVSGELVTYKGDEIVSEKSFSSSLNLEALFTAPERVMVDSEKALFNVLMVASSHDGDRMNVKNNEKFATTSRSLNYNFKFNAGEKVAVATEYEQLAYGDTMFVYSSIQNISYVKCEVNENAAKSSDELKVVDVILYFNVEVAENDPAAKEASKLSTYTVAVPYERAMKVEVEQPEQPVQPTEPEQPAKPIEKVIPETWGEIIGAGISAVPADQVNGQYAQKCLTIRTSKGAVAIVFNMANEAPEVSSILSGYFVKGNFGVEYNSGYFTTNANRGTYAVGRWAPAIAKDLSDRIAYYKDNTCVRNVRNTSLVIWNWRGGNLSTVVDGYGFSVDSNSVLTITYNGKVVLQLR